MQILCSYSIKEIKKYKTSFFHLINPVVCENCNLELMYEESILCCFCMEQFPFTYFENYQEKTPVEIKFENYTNVQDVYSLLYFKKEGLTQNLIHGLKYNFKSNIGLFLGIILAEKWCEKEIEDIDVCFLSPFIQKKNSLEDIIKVK